MAEKLALKIDKPHFVVKLHEYLLEVDLKEGAKKELEDALEAHPVLREGIGLLFQTVVPLDVPLHEIESVKVDDKDRVKIVIPLRRDITIPLELQESKMLAEKMNELIPKAKVREAGRVRRMDEIEERPRPTPRGPL